MGRADPASAVRLIDVTRPLRPGIATYPGDAPFARAVRTEHTCGHDVHVSALSMSAHAGTHVDAPGHVCPEDPDPPPPAVDELPLHTLCGPALVVDLRGVGRIRAHHIHQIPGGVTRVLLRTDNSERLLDVESYVALTANAAAALVSRAVLLVGIDGPSVDPPEALDLPAHRCLLPAGVVVVEGLDLARADAGPCELICLPLKVTGAEAAPARVVLRVAG